MTTSSKVARARGLQFAAAMTLVNGFNACCVVVGLLFSVGVFAAQPPKDVIPIAKAQAIALKSYPGTVKDSELDTEDGMWVYSFDIVGSDKKINQVWVDARNGKIVKHEIEVEGD